MTRRTAVLAAFGVFGVITVVSVGPALAAFPADSVKLYTGCLTGGGNINYVKEGDSPSQPCSSPKQVVKLSGGDITSVSVTGALTGGGVNGALTIGLDPARTVPSSCASGQVPKWSTSGIPAAWACGNDNDTTYSAGTGLDLSGTTFSVRSDAFSAGTGLDKTGTTFSVDPDAFDAGTGLDKTGTTFSVKPDAFAKKGQSCAAGAFSTGSDAGGDLICGTPAGALPAYYADAESTVFFEPDGRYTVPAGRLTLPAGTWAIETTAVIRSTDGDPQAWSCSVAGGTVSGGVSSVTSTVEPDAIDFGAIKVKVVLTQTTQVVQNCNGFNASLDGTISALQVA